jgi:hypothetical protein
VSFMCFVGKPALVWFSPESGVPGVTRTRDRRFRKPMLYPAELRGQTSSLTGHSRPGLQHFFSDRIRPKIVFYSDQTLPHKDRPVGLRGSSSVDRARRSQRRGRRFDPDLLHQPSPSKARTKAVLRSFGEGGHYTRDAHRVATADRPARAESFFELRLGKPARRS